MEWISAKELAVRLRALYPGDFVALCNELLAQAASHGQINATCLDLTLNASDPDGGVDASCTGAKSTVGHLIPGADIVYQFKGGARRKSAAEIARADIIEKPRVIAALKRGGTLVYIAAADYGPGVADRVRQALAEGVPARRASAGRKRRRSTSKRTSRVQRSKKLKIRADQFVLINGDTLSHELQSFPPLIARFLRLDHHLVALEDWARFPPFTNQFETDADLDALMKDLRAQIEPVH